MLYFKILDLCGDTIINNLNEHQMICEILRSMCTFTPPEDSSNIQNNSKLGL